MMVSYESYIPVGSSIIGKTIQTIESEFNIKIDHYHNSPIEIDSKMKPAPEVVLEPGMSIKVCNVDSDILAEFRQSFDLP